jgi:hypothetical protein
MLRPIITVLVLILALNANLIAVEQSGFKNFKSFRDAAIGIDFFASSKQDVEPYEKPAAEAISKLKTLLGENLPKGAIFICSTLTQKDSVYEPMVLKSGYGWSLTVETSAVMMQRMQEQMKQMTAMMKAQGGEVPAQMSQMANRMKSSMSPDMAAQAEKRMASELVQKIAYAVIQTSQDSALQYRSSRVDDMGKSPLPDWLDIGISSYAVGTLSNLSYLQQHLDETFPIEDVLSMSRPFVDSTGGGSGRSGGSGFGGMSGMGAGGSGGFSGMPGGGMPTGAMGGMGGGMPSGGFGGMPPGAMGGMPGGGMGNFGGMPSAGSTGNGSSGRSMGNSGGGNSQRGGMQRNISKDQQDRMLFDGQASTFFAYLIEKIGMDKVKGMINQVQGGKQCWDYLVQDSVLGNNFQKIEEDWINWVKAQQAQPGARTPGMFNAN